MRTIFLKYVIMDKVSVPFVELSLETGQPHYTDHCSVEDELTACAMHTNPL